MCEKIINSKLPAEGKFSMFLAVKADKENWKP
jgi:hypothetical protein